MQAIQYPPSHPGFLIHQYHKDTYQECNNFKTPEKRTKPRNYSPEKKVYRTLEQSHLE